MDSAQRPLTTQDPGPDERAHAGLEKALARIREGSRLEEEAVLGVAWDYFVAGFKARGDHAPDAPFAGPEPEPEAAGEPDFLAEHVAALTPRRLEVLRLVARGLTNREIGRVLGISCYTVKSHLAALFEALDVTNRTEAAFALQRYEAAYPEVRN
ncbi:MAG: LuxR C-terminal-related transcriptional regulator [Myxococcota bacterium]